MNVQWQSGGSNCCLFALAFATELCFKRDPTALLFNQVKMREHLIKDIGRKKQTVPVPSSEVQVKHTSSHIHKCHTSILHRLTNNDNMIKCTYCNRQYHLACVELDENDNKINAELKIRLQVWPTKVTIDWPSVQFDTIMIKFWVAIVENCTENGLGPAVIISSEMVLQHVLHFTSIHQLVHFSCSIS